LSLTIAKAALCAGTFVLALAPSGCRSCHDDHPYVPYSIEPAAGGVDAGGETATRDSASSAPTSDAGSDPFAGRPSIEAPAEAASIVVDGVTLPAPPGHFLKQVLMGEPGGEKTAFAIAQPIDATDVGEVVFYRASGPGGPFGVTTILPAPSIAMPDAGCPTESRLLGVGKHSVLAELGVACASPESAGRPPPTRYVAVIDSGAVATVRFAVNIADPEGSAPLSVDALVTDRDGDGRDDLALRVTLQGGGSTLEPGPAMSVVSAWLDRLAGPSRDTEATEASFRSLSEWPTAHAGRAKDAPDVPVYVAHVRELWRAACTESGAARVTAAVGSGFTCNVPHVLEALGLAEARAFATMGAPLWAGLALDRAERPPSTRTPARIADALKWISQKAPEASARLVRSAAAVPVSEIPHEPSWGPLAFEATGKLLIRTRAGVVRLDPDLGDEAAAGVPDWKSKVTSPDGAITWTAAYDNCDDLPLRASFEGRGGADRRETRLPFETLDDRCTASRAGLVSVLPVAWGDRGLEAIVDGQPLLIMPDLIHASPLAGFVGQPPTPGSPRSPDGKTYVIPTDVGFVVQGEAGSRLLRASELDNSYMEQEHCVVSNDATHVACVHLGAVWVGTWDAPGPAHL
jgi:hypothetical protein